MATKHKEREESKGGDVLPQDSLPEWCYMLAELANKHRMSIGEIVEMALIVLKEERN